MVLPTGGNGDLGPNDPGDDSDPDTGADSLGTNEHHPSKRAHANAFDGDDTPHSKHLDESLFAWRNLPTLDKPANP
jgi:hypothetical protein